MSALERPDDWSHFLAGFRWKAGEHLTVLGKTGSGKSWLERWLLEAQRAGSRVVLIDTKAADDLWRYGFRTVSTLPNWLEKQVQRIQRSRGNREWIRVIPPMSRAQGRIIVRAFMNMAWRLGSTTLVFDETRSIAGSSPNLGLNEPAHVLWQRGRAKGVSVMAGSQSPVFVPRAAFDEITHLFVGKINDIRRLKLIEGIAGDREELVDLVKGLGRYEFAYVPPDGPLQVVRAPGEMPGGPVQRGRRDRGLMRYLYER